MISDRRYPFAGYMSDVCGEKEGDRVQAK